MLGYTIAFLSAKQYNIFYYINSDRSSTSALRSRSLSIAVRLQIALSSPKHVERDFIVDAQVFLI
jgi:hypothetical protein